MADQKTIRRNRESILRNLRAKEKRPEGRRRLTQLLDKTPSTQEEFTKMFNSLATTAQQKQFVKNNPTFSITPSGPQKGRSDWRTTAKAVAAYNKPRKRGGTVKRKAGGKIMQGYKAGGKV